MVVDFLANNYIWFLVISIILCLSLIGYLVDMKEQKKWSTYGTVSKEMEQNFEQLAAMAKNQTLNQAIQSSKMPNLNQNNNIMQNQNTQMPLNGMAMPALNNNQSQSSFEKKSQNVFLN